MRPEHVAQHGRAGLVALAGLREQDTDLVDVCLADITTCVEMEPLLDDVQAATRTRLVSGSGRPMEPTLTPDTSPRIAAPSAVAKNSITPASGNRATTSSQSPAGMPEPMKSRIGLWSVMARSGSRTIPLSIVQV